jgi:hypothetical protein
MQLLWCVAEPNFELVLATDMKLHVSILSHFTTVHRCTGNFIRFTGMQLLWCVGVGMMNCPDAGHRHEVALLHPHPTLHIFSFCSTTGIGWIGRSNGARPQRQRPILKPIYMLRLLLLLLLG